MARSHYLRSVRVSGLTRAELESLAWAFLYFAALVALWELVL